MDTETRILNERKEKLEELRKAGINPYAYRFEKNAMAAEIKQVYDKLQKEEKDTKRNAVRVAGRIVARRIMGKASFAQLLDESGQIQLYFKQDDVGADAYALFKKLDIGDIIGVEGVTFKTHTGEITVNVNKFELLTKSIRPLPEKFHGLKDTEIRFRQRYVDLIVNPDVRKTFVIRTKLMQAIREFLLGEGYLEVETPTLQPVYGGASAKPFVTHHNALDMPLYMRVSDEMYLKRLIVGGFEKVFEFCKDFRNEGIDTTHNPEFTQMETMTAYDDYTDSMDRTERMFEYVAKKVLGTTELEFDGKKISLKAPFKRIKMADAVKEITGVDFSDLKNFDIGQAREVAREHRVEIDEDMSVGFILAELCGELAEPKFIQPTFITDYPKDVSPLAKPVKENPDFTERFELLIAGMEFGNMYSELNDPALLRENWEQQEDRLSKGDEEAQRTDEDFIRAMEYGMPPTSGIGIGIDRVAMLFTNNTSIREVIFFPTLRPEKNEPPRLKARYPFKKKQSLSNES
ncbi:MAG: lysine--tRNA ligase [Nanoarchaeota archaeon]|nr:lysine--tRNA ligase [Nanoarchaeota archaeon]MBU1322063.1 lysine--tRNA ligase [Nanoarchaeota archaeon]MBU1597255.1 lysine--tRNA ligase [Nanoarchaeota archaeon]MBU2440700.1 lysine--tRNA ligase [Nanoarchaeota archaeon]